MMDGSHDGPMGTAMLVTPDYYATQAPAMVALWLMTLPLQAPGGAWDQYQLTCISLRDIPGVPPATRRSPEMTHELLVSTLDPATRVQPHTPLPWPQLQPPNVACQFRVHDDEEAAAVTARCARACVDGELLAETSVQVFPTKPDGRLDLDHGQTKLIVAVVQLWQHYVARLSEHVMTGGHHGRFN